MLADGRQWCAWHVEQASAGWSDVPVLRDGSLTLAQLTRWAHEFDGAGDEAWAAAEFIAWLTDSVGAFRTAHEDWGGRTGELAATG